MFELMEISERSVGVVGYSCDDISELCLDVCEIEILCFFRFWLNFTFITFSEHGEDIIEIVMALMKAVWIGRDAVDDGDGSSVVGILFTVFRFTNKLVDHHEKAIFLYEMIVDIFAVGVCIM